jgi:hypothetical protein
MKDIRQAHVEEEEKKKRSVCNIIPTKIEVNGFNGLDSQMRNGEEHA